jgi:SAM-dependent methyltransferase
MVSDLRVSDIRPDELMRRKRRHLEADQQWLRDRRDQFVEVACVACGADDLEPAWEKLGFMYVRCRDCATVLMNPRPSEEILHRFYERSENYAFWNEHIFPASEDTRRERIFKPRVERTLELCRRLGVSRGTLLEAGAGFGTFCAEIAERGEFEHVIALEPTPGLAQTCRDRGLQTIEAPIERHGLDDGSVDVVAAFEVAEHLFDPAAFVAAARRLLRPGGLILLSVPNILGFDTLVLGREANAVDHEHLNYFNPRSLGHLVARFEFDVEETLTPGRLDVDLVRRAVEEGKLELPAGGFLHHLIGDRQDAHEPFQDFLAANRLSSHLWVVARARPG